MAKMAFFDGSDPNAKAGEFAKCPQGTHEVCGFEWIKTDNNFPVYSPDNYRGLVARVRFLRCDEGISPVGSFTPGELVLIVRAFGGNIKSLPKDRETSNFLVKVEELVKAAGGKTSVTVNEKGWVSRVEGASMPEGLYSFQVVSAKSNDNSEPVRFLPSGFKNGDKEQMTLRVFLKVTGNTKGTATPYDGLIVPVTLYDAWEGQANGYPAWKNTPNNARTAASLKMERMIRAFCPYFEHEWEEDPTRSEYGINELENPVVVVLDKIIAEGRSCVAMYKANKNGNMSVDLSTLDVAEEDVDEEEDFSDYGPQDTGEDIYVIDSPIHKEHPMLCEFINHIWFKCPGAFAKHPVTETKDLILSEAGRDWAEANLQKLWKDAGLEPKAMPVSAITEEMAAALMAVIWGDKKQESDLLWS